MGEMTTGALGTLLALAVSALAVLALFIGFCVVLNLAKLRASGRHSRTIRGLDELVGGSQTFLPPGAPRGRVDQLRSPELLEARARNSA